MSAVRALGAAARRTADRWLEHPWVYRGIQAPFAHAKLAPFLRRVEKAHLRSVLDVGCGPGTNAAHFARENYLGVDINPDYIASARRRFGDHFVVGDVTDPTVLPGATFQCVLANSLLHHLDDDAVRALLSRLAHRVAPGGAIYVMDLVLPEEPSAARLMAKLDRGRYARSLRHWRELLTQSFALRVFEPYALGVPGLPLWQMVYFEGAARS